MSSGAGGEGEFCWASLVARVLHPTDVQIIEALRWIGQPLSAADLGQIFDGEVSWRLLGHHMRRLARLEAVELLRAPTLRNVTDVFYRLVAKRDDDGR